MSNDVKISAERSLEIVREYLMTKQSQAAICRKYNLDRNWVSRKLIKFAVVKKKNGKPMKKLPSNVSYDKDYRDSDRDSLLRRIRELEEELSRTKMARDAYDEMIHLAEQHYNLPIRKKSGAK